MTIKELKAGLASSDHLKRNEAFREFRDGTFGLEALPLLRRLLESDDVQIVITAAECIAKLKPEALTCRAGQKTMPAAGHGRSRVNLACQLFLAGSKVWGYSLYANCYSACLDALVRLKADDELILEYIQMHIGLSDEDLLDSLKALNTLGTPEARGLSKRAVTFWLPELDKTHARKVQAIAATTK